MSKENDFTPYGTKIEGSYENDRNGDSAELFKAMIREAFGVNDVIVAHHLVYVKPEKRLDKNPGPGMAPMEYEFQLVEEIPAADTLIFDHEVAEKLWGPSFKDVLIRLAIEPVATRDKVLKELYENRPQKAKPVAA